MFDTLKIPASVTTNRLFVPVCHGDRARSDRICFLRFFTEGSHRGEVQKGASGTGRGQNSDASGGGAAFVSHLPRFCSRGVSG